MLGGAAAAIGGTLVRPAAAQGFPEKPLRLIVPFAPGGATERTARIVAEKLREELGQPILVENHAGGGTVIGTNLVARAAPDGYTLLLGSNSLVLAPALRSVPYDTLKDLAPVGRMARQPFVLVVHPAVKAETLKELLDLARAQPGRVSYASAGAGTGNHLATELFAKLAGVKLQHVPYQGTGPLMVDLLAGRVQMVITATSIALPYIQAGQLRPLGVGDAERAAELPEVPTIASAGVPGYEATSWNGLLVRGGTPRDVIGKINAALNRALADPATRQSLASTGAVPETSTPEEFGAFIAKELELWRGVIADAGLKPG